MHGDLFANAPAHGKQALHMVGMKMRQQYRRKTAGWKTLTEIRQSCIEQQTDTFSLDGRRGRAAHHGNHSPCRLAYRAVATIKRRRAGGTGAEKRQAHAAAAFGVISRTSASPASGNSQSLRITRPPGVAR